MKIYDLTSCPTSDRDGMYGGMAGSKEGVLINGEYWIIKYPQSTRSMKDVLISYTTAPLSEYIGSHIYSLLGFNVHETILGIRNEKLVVACKDFCKERGSLYEVRTVKNIYNRELELILESSFSSTGEAHTVDLRELLLQLKYNRILSQIPKITESFWDMTVVDILINNNDRNNGNWGVLYEEGKYRLAPIYDNGASFSNKMNEERMINFLTDDDAMRNFILSSPTVYEVEGKQLNASRLINSDYEGLQNSILKLTPLISGKMESMRELIEDIPDTYAGFTVMPDVQKKYYIKSMEERIKELLKPRFEALSQANYIQRDRSNELIR